MRFRFTMALFTSLLFFLSSCDIGDDSNEDTTNDSSEDTTNDSSDTTNDTSDDTGENPLITGDAYLTFNAAGEMVVYGEDDFDVRYDLEKDETILIGPDGGNSFYMMFPGASVGTFTEAEMFVTYNIDPTRGFPWGWVASSAYDGSSMTLEITEYGDVDAWITGTFTGTLIEMHDSEPTGNSLSISDGVFALVRSK